jgi:PAS domain S-box-containing protein
MKKNDKKRQLVSDLATFPEFNPRPVAEVDLKGHILYLNPALKKLFPDLKKKGSRHVWFSFLTPGFIRKLVVGKSKTMTLELTIEHRSFEQAISFIPVTRTIRIYGSEITERKDAEERLKLAQQAANAGFWDWNMRSGKLIWTEAVYRLFGLNPGVKATFRIWLSSIHPDDRKTAMEKIKLAIKKRAPLENEYRIVLPDKQVRWVMALGNTIYEAGKPVRMSGICVDITERKRTEEGLRSSEATLWGILNTTLESIWQFSTDGVILMGNETALRRMGRPSEEIIGKRFSEILPADLARSRLKHLKEAVKSKLPVEFEDQRAGMFFAHNFYPVSDKDGRITSVVCYSRDITDHKQIEDKLKESERLYRAIGESIDYGIWTCAPDGRNIYASESFLKMVGMTQKQCSDFGWGDVLHPDDARRTINAWKKCVRTGKLWDIEHRFRGVDGKWHNVLARGIPVRDEKGTIISWAGINLDISRLKKAEEDLRKSEERLNAAMEAGELGAWNLDTKTKTAWRSLRHDQIFGYKRLLPNWTYGMFLKHVLPEDRKDVDSKFGRAISTNGEWNFECRIKRVDGAVRWIWAQGKPVFNEYHRIVQLSGFVKDITERKLKEEELTKLNRTLKALRDSSNALMRASEESVYLEEVCNILVKDCGYKLVWIGLAENDDLKTVKPVAQAGFEKGYLKAANITWADTERGRGPTGRCIRIGKPCVCSNMLTDPDFAPWRKEALKRGYASSIGIPLILKGKPFGALTLYSTDPDPFSKEEIALLCEMSNDISYGVMSLKLRLAKDQAEENLKKAHEKLKNIIGSITEAYIVWDRLGRFVEVNKYAEKFFGKSFEELRGKTFSEVFPKTRELKFIRNFRKALMRDKDLHFEAFSKIAGRWFETHVYPSARGLTVYLHDITLRKQTEEAVQRMSKHIKHQAETLKTILDAFPDFVYMCDRNLIFTYLNPAGAKALGKKSENFINKSWRDMELPEKDRILLEDKIRSVFSTNKTFKGELRTFFSGEDRVIEYILSPVLGPRGLVESVLATNRDVTERKKMEEALRQTRDYLENLINYANAPIIVWDPDFRIMRFNHAFEFISGYESEEVLGKELDVLFPGENKRESLLEIERALKGEHWDSVEIPIRCKDGVVRTLLWNSANIYSSGKSAILATIAQGQDITERKKAEESLLKARNELEERVSQRTAELVKTQIELLNIKHLSDIGMLGVTIAHELRNPLAAIRVAAFNIKRKKGDIPIDRQLDTIEQRVLESDQIISNLLFYSRLKIPRFEMVKIGDLLDECCEVSKKRSEKQKITFSRRYGALKDFPVEADPLQIKELFSNILNNAVDSIIHEQGLLQVTGSRSGENSISVSIADNGSGIDEKDLERIFEPFFTTKSKGTGLGLAVCKQVVNLHNGTIDVKSQKDKGTVVTITLPEKR